MKAKVSKKQKLKLLKEEIDKIAGFSKRKRKLKVINNPLYAESLKREVEELPSLSTFGNGFKRRENKYTGKLIKGIATMHKSNAVPVISKEQAEDISKMRR